MHTLGESAAGSNKSTDLDACFMEQMPTCQQNCHACIVQQMLAASQSPVKVKVGMTRVIRDLDFNMGV